MLAYEVLLNGERLCVAGVGDEGVLTAIVSWVGRANDAKSSPDLRVRGLVCGEHVVWNSSDSEDWATAVSIGDEITIRIVDVVEVDEPTRLYLHNSDMRPRFIEILEDARSTLPPDSASEAMKWHLYEKYISNHDYRGALYFLADVGETKGAETPFWRKLLLAQGLLLNVAPNPS